MKEKLDAMLTPTKINQYVDEILSIVPSILASSTITDDESIYIRLYGQRRNMHYTIELKDNVEINGYHFRDFIIQKKG